MLSTSAAIPLPALGKPQLECYAHPVTDAYTCCDHARMRAGEGRVRHAPLFSGRPNGVRPTSITLHVNCVTGVVHLKDRDGVSFAAGRGNETGALRSLSSLMCKGPVPGQPSTAKK